MSENKTKRLSVNLPLSVHKLIKEMADIRHLTITRFILRCVIEKIIRDSSRSS